MNSETLDIDLNPNKILVRFFYFPMNLIYSHTVKFYSFRKCRIWIL